MTSTPPEAPADQATGSGHDPYNGGPRSTRAEVRDLGRLRRTTGPDKRIAGVAGGLARHLDIDPVILRVAFVVLVFFGGAGLILYLAGWLLLPADDQDSAPLHLEERSRSVALIIVGVVAALALIGDSFGQLDFPWPLAFVALITLIVLAMLDRRRDRPQPTAPPVPHQPVGDTGQFAPAPGYAASYGASYGTSQTAAYAAPPAPPAPPVQTWTPPPPRVPNPRRRGPILFWFTLALAALGIGVLGIVDLAGAPVADAAYPALVVGTCGVMLLVGAFYGRAGGLILVGLLASLGMAGATASGEFENVNHRSPDTAAAVQHRYEIGAGELVLDLTEVADLENLDGRVINVEGGAASLQVIIPDHLDVDVNARAGLGDVSLFGERQDGGGIEMTGQHDGGTDVPSIILDIQVGLGEIDVDVEPDRPVEPTRPVDPVDPVTSGAPQ